MSYAVIDLIIIQQILKNDIQFAKAKPGIVFITPETESQHYLRKKKKNKLTNKWLLHCVAKLMRLCLFPSMKAKKIPESLVSRDILKSS